MRTAFSNLLRGLAICCAIAVGGCATGKPTAFITPDTPPLPAECLAPTTAEPKLPGNGTRDVMVDEAARDREAMRAAYRNERILRAACKQRLQVLFPQKGAKP